MGKFAYRHSRSHDQPPARCEWSYTLASPLGVSPRLERLVERCERLNGTAAGYKRSRMSMSTRMAAGVSTNTTRSASRRITIFSTLPFPLPFPLFPAR